MGTDVVCETRGSRVGWGRWMDAEMLKFKFSENCSN